MRKSLASFSLLAVISCHRGETRGDARPEGCAVTVYEHGPTVPTQNIGHVSATCGADISDADCLRQLEDQVCALGGDVVWGVGPPAIGDDEKKHLAGRAAHTR